MLLHLKTLLPDRLVGFDLSGVWRESGCRQKARERERESERDLDRRKKGTRHPSLSPPPTACLPASPHFQTLIYNFNISNFHSSAHFPNVIFQFMSNRVTIFLNTAYDKLGCKADMQFRLSVLQAQQQTHWGVCVFIFISVCSPFGRSACVWRVCGGGGV